MNMTQVQTGNGWEEQLCGMKSMALRGSGRPGRRDSIEEDSIFRLGWIRLVGTFCNMGFSHQLD